MKEETFSFYIGSVWPGTGHIDVYTYGNTIWHGDRKYAQSIKKDIQEKTKREEFVYKLVRLDE